MDKIPFPSHQGAPPRQPGHIVEHPPEMTVVVESRVEEADGVVSLVLADPTGRALPRWDPGAHIDLLLAPGLERQYSLCGDPEDTARWRISVLRDPDSRGGSEMVHREVRAGDTMVIRGPRNNFPLVPAESYLFIAGGIGITPLLPMIEQLQPQVEWQLLYGGRTRASMAYRDQLERYGARVTIYPEDERGMLDLAPMLRTPRAGAAVYCCGPEPLLVAVEAEIAGSWPTGVLHLERFRPRPGALDGAATSFELVLAHSGLTVTVGADETIVAALEKVGVSVPTSCLEGTCGTCETEVIEGTPDHRDSFLSVDDKEANETMMVCCSRSKGARLVLDL
jgi:ferredoxin-NADP reductase